MELQLDNLRKIQEMENFVERSLSEVPIVLKNKYTLLYNHALSGLGLALYNQDIIVMTEMWLTEEQD